MEIEVLARGQWLGRFRRLGWRLWTLGYPVAAGAVPMFLFAIIAVCVAGALCVVLMTAPFLDTYIRPTPDTADPPFPVVWVVIRAIIGGILSVCVLLALLLFGALFIALLLVPVGWLLAARKSARSIGVLRFAAACVLWGLLWIAALFTLMANLATEFLAGLTFFTVATVVLAIPYFLALWIGGATDSALRRFFEWAFGKVGDC